MAYDLKLAERVREYLKSVPGVATTEKKMFGGLAFLIGDKMCINVSGDRLMCRFDAALQETVTKKKGFEAMVMRGKAMEGYCYVLPEGFKAKKDFDYWVNLCLDFNDRAKSSKKK